MLIYDENHFSSNYINNNIDNLIKIIFVKNC